MVVVYRALDITVSLLTHSSAGDPFLFRAPVDHSPRTPWTTRPGASVRTADRDQCKHNAPAAAANE